MLGIQDYEKFVAAIVLFQLVPGPGSLAILNATARSGMGAGMGAVMGTLLGDFAYMVAAVLGLATVMNANPVLFQGLQWFGAAYLCWMGAQLLFARGAAGPALETTDSRAQVYFRQALAVSATNPKVILFFVAFFPLFLRADASSLTLAIMMAHVTVISLVYQAALVFVGNAVARRLSALPSARKIASRLAGAALVGFGVKLALDRR
jgi:leucine efflux protein